MICSLGVFSQDRIIKTTSDTIYCKVIEIGSIEVKYKLPNYPQEILFSLESDKISKVIFDNGMEKLFANKMFDPANYVDNKKNAIKLHFISPLVGNLAFSYEKSIKPGRSMEFGAAIIFGYSDLNLDDQGFLLRAGYKFIRTPDFYFNNMLYSHILKGSYIKPELLFNTFSTRKYNYNTGKYVNGHVTSFSLVLVAGKQIVFDNAFIVDYYCGIGYGYTTDDYVDYYYSNAIMDFDIPVSITMGLKVGFLM